MANEDKKIELPTESKIKKASFNNFMTKLFGFRRKKNSANTIEFTKVDLGSEERVGQAFLNQVLNTGSPLSENLEKLFNLWLNDNTDKLSEIQKRRDRIDQLCYAVLNDPYIGRTVQLYADEACQLDVQDTIINIETPDPRMTRDMYKLLSQWGVTQTRIRSTIENLAIYGDAFWANKISDKGVERIIPLQQLQITDRIEFNPVQALESKKRHEGSFNAFASSNYLIQQMLDEMENTGDFADIFDTKLFGFSIVDSLVVPPWAITHFRVGSDLGQFWPFGTSPIIGTLAPFKQISSTIALQSLARIMSFPITLYKVKTSDTMDEGRQFEVVNRVREAYDNVGVSPAAGNSEVYTVNTKIWVPEGLLDVDVKESKVDIGFTDDIEIYQDRVAVASGLPKSFYSEEWYGFGNSGKSLVQQYKPFGRKVFSLQTAFLESLADLFRIHFAITGQYDFRIPFTLSMKFPAEEVDSERTSARKDSIDVANTVIDLVRSAIGLSDEDSLPPDIIRDIIGKYTFLDPVDIMKWTRDATYTSFNPSNKEGEDKEGGKEDSGFDFGGSEPSSDFDNIGGEDNTIDIPTESTDTVTAPAEDETLGEMLQFIKTSEENYRLTEEQKKLTEKYMEKKEEIYFSFLENSNVSSFTRNKHHVEVFKYEKGSNSLMLNILSKNRNDKVKLKESLGKNNIETN